MRAWRCTECGTLTTTPVFRLSDGFVRQRHAGGNNAVMHPAYREGAWCELCFRAMVDGGTQTEMFPTEAKP